MRIVSTYLLVVMCSATALGQFADDLRIVREDARSAVVEFVPNYLGRTTDTQFAQEVQQDGVLRFYGFLYDVAEPGTPVDYYRATSVSLPSSRYSLQIVSTEYQDVSGVQQYITPALESDPMGFVSVPVERSSVLRRETRQHEIAELVNVSPQGTHYRGVLKLYPVQYSSDGRSARIYTRIVVRINFDGRTEGETIDALKSDLSPRPAFKSARSALADSPLATGEWYKLDITETGIYRLDRDFFTSRNITVAQIGNIHSIRLFANDGRELPEDVSVPRPDGIEEVPRHILDRNGNGQFDADDAVFFYGKSTRGWWYNDTTKTYHHYINSFTETNSYFLTFGGSSGMAMDSISSTNSQGAVAPSDFQGKFFVEEELFNYGPNAVSSGRQWWGKSFDQFNRTQTYTNLLPGIVASQPVTYRYVLLTRSATIDTFTVAENNQPLGNPIITGTVSLSSIEGAKYYRTPVITATRTGEYPDERSVLRFSFGIRSIGALGWIDWFEILYRCRFDAVSDFLLFTSPDTTALLEYRLNKFSSREVQVFDVSDFRNVRRIVNLAFNPLDPTVCSFQADQTSGSVREFVAVGATGYKTPSAVTKLPNSNLYGESVGADFIIISPPEFFSAANRLKAHRERPGADYLKTSVVSIESIFNEFSNGLLDPMAIRDFLKYTLESWPIKPRYVLLFGDGSYDYKNNLNRTQKENWIIPYETVNSIHQIDSFTSDDFYILHEPPGNYNIAMAMGRLPLRSLTDADSMVSKIIRYETALPFDTWRNRITFVGDDGLTSTGDERATHTSQVDNLARVYTPVSFDRQKIYIVEYPTVIGSAGRRKPEANTAIVNAINNGTLILNYTGHGNTKVWAHEFVFTDDADLPRMTNSEKPFVLTAATCDYARWDLPDDRSAGERILVDASGGAVAVVTAARAVYAHFNEITNNALFSVIFNKDSLNLPIRLGDAMRATKQLLLNTPTIDSVRARINLLKYHLLGDPTMRLAMPRIPTVLDNIAGRPASDTVSIPTLGKTTISGRVLQQDSTLWSDFTGRALVEVFDTKRVVTIPEWGNYTFEKNGSLLYRGELSVTNGAYQTEFPIPKDVSYKLGNARISVYAWGNNTDGVGYTERVRIEGTDTTAVSDTTGPQIRVFLDAESFRPGDVVKPETILYVELFDESGINTSTAGVGHRLEAVLSSQSQPIDLTEYYRGNLDTYQSGVVVYPLTGLPEGRHTLTLRAWDIHNNSEKLETYFDVRVAADAAIFNVLNFPNPFSNTTMFTFQRNSFEPVDVEIKIYTLAGRLIESLSVPSVADRFVQIPWNGRDRDGNELANGVYFYKVITRSLDRSQSTETLGKLTVLR